MKGLLVIFSLVLSGFVTGPAWAGCWSVLRSPEWERVDKSISSAKVCEVLPVGPNKTGKIKVSKLDVCSSEGGLEIQVKASLECKTDGGSFIKLRAKGALSGSMAVDIGTCTVTASQFQMDGAIGDALGNQKGLQDLLRALAQARLSNLCGR